ncbi:MAG: hypothetical protein ACKN87_01870 [Microcystis aeruginosa]
MHEVAYVGQPIAVVVANTRHAARLAAGLVEVDLQTLPPQNDFDNTSPIVSYLGEAAVEQIAEAIEERPIISRVVPIKRHRPSRSRSGGVVCGSKIERTIVSPSQANGSRSAAGIDGAVGITIGQCPINGIVGTLETEHCCGTSTRSSG